MLPRHAEATNTTLNTNAAETRGSLATKSNQELLNLNQDTATSSKQILTNEQKLQLQQQLAQQLGMSTSHSFVQKSSRVLNETGKRESSFHFTHI